MVCDICGGSGGVSHTFREMMFGTRDEFPYWECSTCGCLRIVKGPERLSDYYPDDYYSFNAELSPMDKLLYRAYFKAPRLGQYMRRVVKDLFFADQKFQSVVDAKPGRRSRILDVGCGAGKMVVVLRGIGYNAHGVDPFLKQPSPYLHQSSLDDMEGGWDLIMFHHALEHMEDHVKVLRTALGKLNPGGACLVRIPIAGWAWKHYGRDWVQLDAPRHLVIHTPESFQKAARQAGFGTPKVTFDSSVFQFFGSELYQRDIPLSEMERQWPLVPKADKNRYIAHAIELNQQQTGDQASFLMRAAN